MLEERELPSVSVPAPEPRSGELLQTELKEVGVRHMSTLAGSHDAPLFTPMPPTLLSSPSPEAERKDNTRETSANFGKSHVVVGVVVPRLCGEEIVIMYGTET